MARIWKGQNLEGLFGELQPEAMFAQFPRIQGSFKNAEARRPRGAMSWFHNAIRNGGSIAPIPVALKPTLDLAS